MFVSLAVVPLVSVLPSESSSSRRSMAVSCVSSCLKREAKSVCSMLLPMLLRHQVKERRTNSQALIFSPEQ